MRWMERQGARILGRNVRTRAGEIDLVALEGKTLVLVEVKTRSGPAGGLPEEAVDARRLRRLSRAGEAYAAAHGLTGARMRIDVIALDAVAEGGFRCRRRKDVTS